MKRTSWYLALAIVAAVVFVVTRGRASAQLTGYSLYNPRTGRVVERIEGYSPYAGEFGVGSAYLNPYTGAYGRAGVGYSPYTGTSSRTVVRYNPYLGQTLIRERAYNPYTGLYGWRRYALPGRW
jgi:hypothetical protein